MCLYVLQEIVSSLDTRDKQAEFFRRKFLKTSTSIQRRKYTSIQNVHFSKAQTDVI